MVELKTVGNEGIDGCRWECVNSVVGDCVFFFKQKTAYEMRISDWSSDVCSSDLRLAAGVTIDFAAVERGPYGFLAATGPTFEQDGLLAGGDLERRIAVVVGWAANHAI